MKVFLDKKKEDIMNKIGSILNDTVEMPNGQYLPITEAYSQLQNDMSIAGPYPYHEKQLELLKRAHIIYMVVTKNQDIASAFQVLLDSMQPDSELDKIILDD